VVTLWEVDGHHEEMLRRAVALADRVEQLDALVDEDGPVIESPQGRKVHPALVESRHQTALLARLLAALGLPDVAEDVQAGPGPGPGPVDGRTRGRPRGPYRLHAVGGDR
jgi:hypothetical protein